MYFTYFKCNCVVYFEYKFVRHIVLIVLLHIKDVNFDLRGDISMASPRIVLNGNKSSINVQDYPLFGTGTTCINITGQVEVRFLIICL